MELKIIHLSIFFFSLSSSVFLTLLLSPFLHPRNLQGRDRAPTSQAVRTQGGIVVVVFDASIDAKDCIHV